MKPFEHLSDYQILKKVKSVKKTNRVVRFDEQKLQSTVVFYREVLDRFSDIQTAHEMRVCARVCICTCVYVRVCMRVFMCVPARALR